MTKKIWQELGSNDDYGIKSKPTSKITQFKSC